MSDAALAGVPGGPRGGVAEPLVTRPFNVLGTRFECPVRYTLIKPIGQGAYGIVWYVVSDGGAARALFIVFFSRLCACVALPFVVLVTRFCLTHSGFLVVLGSSVCCEFSFLLDCLCRFYPTRLLRDILSLCTAIHLYAALHMTT